MAGETEHYDHDDAEALPKAEELADIFSLDLSQFTLGNVIGRGHFSTVLLAKRKDDKDRDGALFAVKRQIRRTKELEGHQLRELHALKTCHHENILRLIGACDQQIRESTHVLWIVTEFARGGNLLQLLESEHDITWLLRVRIVHDAAMGLQHLHTCGQIHRDVKSSNFLLTRAFQCKVADLGMARPFDKESTPRKMTICGTEDYMAPELIFDEHYDGKVDVFGLGMVLFELLSRRAIGSVEDEEEEGSLSPASKTGVRDGKENAKLPGRQDSETPMKDGNGVSPGQRKESGSAAAVTKRWRRNSKPYSLTPEPMRRIKVNPSQSLSPHGSEDGFLRRSPHNRFRFDEDELREAPPKDSPPSLVELAVQCVSYEAALRPDMDVVVDWLEDLTRDLAPEGDPDHMQVRAPPSRHVA
uniref:Protein kinase domain-containing protein n=1 Tax=Pinguiococcus pyrenoidosus TaxID=172671 RepID=A0A7R9U3L7_9STRA|mmetsp:Transcript_13688/g.51025  ORF Transcript_13688/g.51025 Transcript_13688/m.51025 type:complete len:415 (+) Transcript_13688:317-1561(+)